MIHQTFTEVNKTISILKVIERKQLTYLMELLKSKHFALAETSIGKRRNGTTQEMKFN